MVSPAARRLCYVLENGFLAKISRKPASILDVIYARREGKRLENSHIM